MHSILRKIFKI